MSYDYSKRVWATNLKGGKLLVMLALAQHADANGNCYPGADTLAAMARLTDRQVRRVLNSLEKSGHIVIEQRAIGRGKKPSYSLFPALKADKMSDQKEEIMSDLAIKAEEMSTLPQESGQNVHDSSVKADISDNKSGHFDTIKADISASIQSHARSESHLESQEELREKEKAQARDPLTVAWQQVYVEVEMPPKLTKSLQELVTECGMAATIHGIKASALKPDGRNFRYIAECARNYVPPPPITHNANYANGKSYHVEAHIPDIPGVVVMQPTGDAPKPPPKPAAPMQHDDPWAICLAELVPTLSSQAAEWLRDSRLSDERELAGEPFYQVLVTHPKADLQWLTQQTEPVIRRKLRTLLGKRVLIGFVAVEVAVTP